MFVRFKASLTEYQNTLRATRQYTLGDECGVRPDFPGQSKRSETPAIMHEEIFAARSQSRLHHIS